MAVMTLKGIDLIKFLKGDTNPKNGMPGCANYDRHYGSCLFCHKDCTEDKCRTCLEPQNECLVEQGTRCGYFEKFVLPTAEQIGRLAEISDQYSKHTGAKILPKERVDRTCPDCGGVLRPRQRYCDKCSRSRQRIAKREHAKIKRLSCVGVDS